MAYEGSLSKEHSSNMFGMIKKQVSMANVSSEPSLCGLQKPELQNCMEQIADLILKEIPRAEYVSLLNDYVESEFFLIDGDSLFITYTRELTLKRGQNLHFFYLVERYLKDLTSKGAKYIIVFFKDVEYTYYRNPDLLSLRTSLIVHLRNNTETTVHTEFSNCLDGNWQMFLEENYPYFLIISDEGLDQLQTSVLHIFILHTLSKRINVMLTSGQQSDLIRVYGYHIPSLHKHQRWFEQCETRINLYYQTLVEHLKESSTKMCLSLFGCPDLESLTEKIHARITQFQKEIEDVRYIVCIVTCSLVIEMYNQVLESQTASAKPAATPALTLQEAGDLIRMCCLSVVFLHHLPLSQRAKVRLINVCWNKETQTFIQQLKLCEFHVLRHLSTEISGNIDFSALPDLSDDLLWKNIACYYEVEKGPEFDLDMGLNIKRDYELLWKHITTLSETCNIGPSFPLRTASRCFLEEKCSSCEDNAPKMTFPKPGLVPITNTIVNEFAGDILIDLPFLKSDDPVATSSVCVKHKEFDELLHWHSGKPLSDDYDRTAARFQGVTKDPRALRSYQKLQTYQRFYGQSLEGISSKRIVTQLDTPKKVYTDTRKSKKIQKTKAEIIVEENQKRKQAEEEKKEACQWSTLSVSFEKKIKENMTAGIKYLENFLKNCHSLSVKRSAEMTGLKVCLEMWKEHCKMEGKTHKNFNIAAEVMRRVHSLIVHYEGSLEDADSQQIVKCLWNLGFDNLAATLSTKVLEDEKKKLKGEHSKYAVGMGSARFQLQYMSHYLIREERKDPDPRVQHFIPDTWQRQLLDTVDNNESAVIVAPTSSGKTYASYYCMEKVLRDGDEGVVVYVAPTKALVNQVWATIYNRFDKALPAGLTVCGVFTRDYREDALNCQILVTVPQCLEILLLSPHRQGWAKRIRYVIFDEVHCLGGEIGAEVWEHLLVMIRCPFLALSATISNPEHLADWLQSVKKYWEHAETVIAQNSSSFTLVKKGAKEKRCARMQNTSYRVKLVIYEERYNDLEKHVCSLNHGDFTIHHYHPCAALTVHHIERYGFPLDLSLSPRETVILYDTMVKVRKNWQRSQELDPEEVFKDKIVITKADARHYEKKLKEELEMWIKHGNKQEANRVLLLLKPQPTSGSEKEMRNHFPHFVEKLQQMNKLPALFFLFSIKRVEEWAEGVRIFLEEKQRKIQTPISEKQQQQLTQKCKKIAKSLRDQNGLKRVEPRTESACSLLEDGQTSKEISSFRKQEKLLKKSKMTEKMLKAKQNNDLKLTHKHNKTLARETELDSVIKQLEKISEIPSGCTYANEHAVDQETLHKIFDRARFSRKIKVLQKLAHRGIGYHHSSVDAKGRQIVEMLFRLGFLQVVTATGTLALGINMPCKSVVFVQNSVYLDALTYRQMSGRAGRRGQDLLGNVFFYDIPVPKIQKLMKSNVPELRGQFPLSISLILRLMLLASKAHDKEDAKAKVLSLLKHSLLSFKQPKILEVLKLYFLFCVQFLVKEGYVDQEGNTIGFSGLVTHLHYHEPSNIVLVEFLVKGLFHKLCQPSKEGVFSKDVMETLVLVLAHLFGRKLMPAAAVRYKKEFYQSKVFLEDLPEDFAAALDEYNCKIQDNFGQFIQIVSTMADMEQEYKLPLSNLDFASKQQPDSQLASHLMNCDQGRTAVSPFACLSGNTELDLLNAGTVNSVILHTLGITAANIPVLPSKVYDNQGRMMPLNAYALDFYKHGSLIAMDQDNGIHEGDAYRLLKDFALALKAISASLRELCDNEADNVVQAFEQLSVNYWVKLNKV